MFGFDRSDAGEALLGSFLFGIPMFDEGGTTEVGEFIAARPTHVLLTNALTVALMVGILYVADFQDVQVHQISVALVPMAIGSALGDLLPG